jgi:hypothetical protein
MTWHPIQPRAGAGVHAFDDAAIGIALLRGGAALSVGLNRAKLPGAWKPGVLLSAAIGSGEHYRKLRLAQDGLAAFKLTEFRRTSSRPSVLSLRLPLPAGIERRAVARVACRMVRDGDALVIDLPDFAAPKPARPVDVAGALMGDPTSPRVGASARPAPASPSPASLERGDRARTAPKNVRGVR